MLFRPKFCANCGEKIERTEWRLWTNRRFCELCATEFQFQEYAPRIVVGLAVVAIISSIGSYFGSGTSRSETSIAKQRAGEKSTTQIPNASVLPPNSGNNMVLANSSVSPVVQESRSFTSIPQTKPMAVEKPAQIVAGSETAKKLAAAPAVDTKAIDLPNVDAPIDPAVMTAGKISFILCAACHGQNGEGGQLAPPLAGSDWVAGPVSNLIRIQLRGLQGPITVTGKEYNLQIGMAALNYQTDEQIAGVLTYVRNSFGNKASAVRPEQVTALRSEVGKPQLTVGELTKP